MQQLLGTLKKGLLFVVSAPAGTGKTTLVRMLCREFPSVVESISYTTRQPRSGEVSGKDYHFITPTQFEKRISEGDFLEYAKVFDHYYGTSQSAVESERLLGHHVVLVIDTQGAMQLMGRLDAIFIFIAPPNFNELKRRLRHRDLDNPKSIEKRLSWAKHELELACHYDYQVVNDRLETAYEALRAILIAEAHRTFQKKPVARK